MAVPLERDLIEGAPFTGEILELGGSASFADKLDISGISAVVFLEPSTDLQGIRKVALIDFGTFLSHGRFKLVFGPTSRAFLDGTFDANQLLHVKEARAGIGAWGRGGNTIGFKVVARNELQPRTAEVAATLATAPVITGDINDISIVAVWDALRGIVFSQVVSLASLPPDWGSAQWR